MKQPKIRVWDIHGQDYGIKTVTAVNWNNDGEVVSIMVNYLDSDMYPMVMIAEGNLFKNLKGNLIGRRKIGGQKIAVHKNKKT